MIYLLILISIIFILALLLICKVPSYPKWEISNLRQEVDGEYYVEGKYWNISSIGLTPIVVVTFTDKDKIEEMANIFSKYMTCKVYNTLEPYGKIVYDAEHCERYIRSKF